MDRFKRCTTGSRRVGNASVAEVLNQERCTQDVACKKSRERKPREKV